MKDFRHIRVYVSSHFRDMHAERDHLASVVLPQLTASAYARFLTIEMIDLRLGAADEATAEDRVLNNFVEEIRHCRPYFIGLLGEQYGWKPAGIPDYLLEKEPWLIEQLNKRNSILEMEFLHGALLAPELASRACFYLRDPNYIDSLPEPDRKLFTSNNAIDSE